MRTLDGAALYLVASHALSSSDLGAAIDAGVGIVQLRMKDADAALVLAEGERFKKVCDARVPLVINDRPDVALALGADGVHLGQDDVPPHAARDILGPQAIIGRSTHSVEDVDRALAEYGAGVCDYFAVGPVFHTPTHPERAAVGLDLVSYASQRASFPWYAIGGIDATNIADVVSAGARRVCVVRAIVDARDPAEAAKTLRQALP